MKKLVLMFFVLVSLFSFSQSATVFELSQQDQKDAKFLYQSKVDAEKSWDNFTQTLKDKYKGFDGYDIDFSPDFRFVVPKIKDSKQLNNCFYYVNGFNVYSYYCPVNLNVNGLSYYDTPSTTWGGLSIDKNGIEGQNSPK